MLTYKEVNKCLYCLSHKELNFLEIQQARDNFPSYAEDEYKSLNRIVVKLAWLSKLFNDL